MTDDPKALIAEAGKARDEDYPITEIELRELCGRLADSLEREMARPINVTLASDDDVAHLLGIALGPITRS